MLACYCFGGSQPLDAMASARPAIAIIRAASNGINAVSYKYHGLTHLVHIAISLHHYSRIQP